LVARLNGVQEAAGSTPVTRTRIKRGIPKGIPRFILPHGSSWTFNSERMRSKLL